LRSSGSWTGRKTSRTEAGVNVAAMMFLLQTAENGAGGMGLSETEPA
jgi:hypothetical protein